MAYTEQPEGLLAWIGQQVRFYSEEAEVQKKWTDEKVWPIVVDLWERVMDDVNGLADNPIVVDYSFPITPETDRVLMPGNVGQIIQVGRAVDGQGYIREAVVPRHRLNPLKAGVLFQGNCMKFEPRWPESETLVLQYIPNGYCSVHLGYTDSNYMTTTTAVLDVEPDQGYFDKSPNGPIGCVFRLLGSEEVEAPNGYVSWPVEERMVVDYDVETATVTLDPALTIDLSEGGYGQCRYELVPMFGTMFKNALVWGSVATIHGIKGTNPKKEQSAWTQYAMALRAIKSQVSNINARTGSRFLGDMPGNGRFGLSLGF